MAVGPQAGEGPEVGVRNAETETAARVGHHHGRRSAVASVPFAPVAVSALIALVAACAGGTTTAGPGPRPAPRAPRPGALHRTIVEPPPIPRGQAPPPGPYAPGFRATHYAIALTLPDSGTYLHARALARVALVPPYHDTLRLDLSGLAVDSVRLERAGARQYQRASFTLRSGKLLVPLPAALHTGDTVQVEVGYEGHVDDGLIMEPDVHGNYTVFADNWPNRARYWFPSIDHPSEKATVSFTVNAPASWAVVANGTQRSSGELAAPPPPPGSGRRRVWHWATNVPIPTYTMVIGAGRMDVLQLGRVCGVHAGGGCLPITAYAFPQDSASAATAFRRAPDMVRYFASLVGPFSYAKLAHVESATIFGGMENASAIFYDQKALAAGRLSEATVAHETAHQWFGDAVTESNWHHLWLSEGFATYFSALFMGHVDGRARFHQIMQRAAERYFASDVVDRPVIDTTETDLLALLNANNYQKGAWVLHMLRSIVGDSAFFHGLRIYYAAHRNGNALTRDLESAMEQASGQDLGWFFHQWLWEPGYPQLTMTWHWDPHAGHATITVRQVQPATWPTFRIPLTLAIATAGGRVLEHAVLRHRVERLEFALAGAPTGVTLDPDGQVLMQVEPAGGS